MSYSIDHWIVDVTRALPGQTAAQKKAVADELRDHMNTRLAQGHAVEEILAGFGDATSFARQLSDGQSSYNVLLQRQSLNALRGLIGVIARSITAAFALVMAGVCGLMAFAVLRLVAEDLGLFAASLAATLPDLGLWTLPAAIISLFCLWAVARLSLKLAVTSLRLDPAQ